MPEPLRLTYQPMFGVDQHHVVTTRYYAVHNLAGGPWVVDVISEPIKIEPEPRRYEFRR